LADVEWFQMADKIKVFPLVILAVLVVLGLVLYFVATRKSETRREAEGSPVDPAPGGKPEPRERPAGPKGSVEAPPPSNDPGQKILEGADNAFKNGWFDAALKFYKDFELRYAGTEVYDRNITKVWERIHTSGASMPKKDETLPAYLDSRRKLADEWKRIKPLLGAAPTAESKAELQKFFNALPPADGRLKLIEAWRDEKK
jgi:hypothetical protein